jgi:hypothetical protein
MPTPSQCLSPPCPPRYVGRAYLGQFDAPSMAVAALKNFSQDVPLQVKALTALAKLASNDAANTLLIEWADGCAVICQAIKRHALTKEILVRAVMGT